MPASGGASDKLGNRYEALWAIDQLLQIIDGAASELTLEPLDPVESRGIEFLVVNADGTVEYWSVKRQTTMAAGWSLAILTRKDDRGRSILGDLLSHVEQNPSVHRSVFASTLGAPVFDELRAHAINKKMLDDRLNLSTNLKSDFQDRLVPLCAGNAEMARAFLLSTRTHAADESQLRERVGFAIRKLFYVADGSPIDTAAVRGYLGDLLLKNIHQPICQDTILKALHSHGIRRCDWAIEKTVTDRIAAMCESYSEPIRSQLINGTFLQIHGSDCVLGTDGFPTAPKVLVVGGAGGGKSCTLYAAVEKLRDAGVPVLPLRFDQVPEGILTTTELGRRLGLPESPAIVLAGVASGGRCVLVMDQLDAVSIASGRKPEMWSLFDDLRREAEQNPAMSLLVGCREFDLEHDQRIRALKKTSSGFKLVELKPLSPVQVDAALSGAGIALDTVPAPLKPILIIPLHLSMYLSLSAAARIGVRSRDELLDYFWKEKERMTVQRLGRKADWTQVIDKLANWLSKNQQLFAPQLILDDYSADAAAMASEHVLVLADGQYRFFHESFFDYAFARRFVAGGIRIVDLLISGEQHLFRRAQVRQILAYLRAKIWRRYLTELESVLTTNGIRFHISSFVLQWMSSLPDPRLEEWAILKRLLSTRPEFRSHVQGVMGGNEEWFDVLDVSGFFQETLTNGDEPREQQTVWLFALPNTLAKRSSRVATLLKQFRKPNEAWKQYLRFICRNGEIYHSREMFDLFLSLIDDGTLDGVRPGFAVNDDWWSTLYSMGEKKPEFACEAIGHWFDRVLATWEQAKKEVTAADQESGSQAQLSQHLDRSRNGTHVILAATKAPKSFVEQLLPRVARFVNDTAKNHGDRLQNDPLWSFRHFGDDPLQVHAAILCGLAKSLEALARTEPAELDRLIAPYKDRPHDAIAYLVLRAWTAASDTYANQLADYLVSDPRRLKMGYASWDGDGGSAANYVSSQAVKIASAYCTPERLMALETAIINLTDEWEIKNPPIRGCIQLELLEAIDASRLSTSGLAKLRELQAKFPAMDKTAPRSSGISIVGSPVPEDVQAKMSDEQWVGAMREYAHIEHRRDRPFGSSGGEHELAQALEAKTKADPVRFAALGERMTDDLPGSYFNAILRGVANCMSQAKDAASPAITLEQVVQLLRRVHRLPGRPCGLWIAYLIEKWQKSDWPPDVVDAVAWYACNDPDPDKELWRTPAGSGQCYYGGDPYAAGINSTRGSMAGAVARLLFDNPGYFERLKDAARSLSHDRSVAVLACAIQPLLAILKIDSATAIAWFKECMALDAALLETNHVEQFIHFAVDRDYTGIRPVMEAMLKSGSEKVVEAGARQVCLAAMDDEAAKTDAETIRGGIPTMRKAAAEVYSANVAHNVVGGECQKLLKPFFADADESVRAEAASAFRNISGLSTEMQADLLAAFLNATPSPKALERVVRALEDSPVQLPDLVCKLAEKCVEAFRNEGGDISKTGSMVAMDLSKIVIRLYTQTGDRAIQSRCLMIMDEMERYHFLGLSDELRKLDR